MHESSVSLGSCVMCMRSALRTSLTFNIGEIGRWSLHKREKKDVAAIK